ncbi:putative methylase [uncultured Mediterranean phage uvMED]|nr:putative methylase [uncultured Mediterranean phage uvMED]BAR22602.1 DNA modification methylase (COG0863) [uncultured Mediterranean phage uvMED]
MNITNEDNMELMARYPDNYFDLAIVDPPYGINASKGVGLHSRKKFQKADKEWDNETPKQEYWDELFRVSKNQIICGANYFLEYLYSSKSFICWVKNNPSPNFAQAEFLWTSTNVNGKVYDSGKQIQHEIMWEGGSIHPTQKPVKLYEWLLMNYAKESDKILDTHLGSGSIAIACHNMKFDLTACELDKEYFEKAMERIENHKKQLTLF